MLHLHRLLVFTYTIGVILDKEVFLHNMTYQTIFILSIMGHKRELIGMRNYANTDLNKLDL